MLIYCFSTHISLFIACALVMIWSSLKAKSMNLLKTDERKRLVTEDMGGGKGYSSLLKMESNSATKGEHFEVSDDEDQSSLPTDYSYYYRIDKWTKEVIQVLFPSFMYIVVNVVLVLVCNLLSFTTTNNISLTHYNYFMHHTIIHKIHLSNGFCTLQYCC